MENQTKRHNLFLILFITGVLSGVILTTLSTWADLEAAYYGFSRRASTRLSGFSCPILMTANESNVVLLKLNNSTDGKISPTVLVETSSPVTAFEFTDNLELAAGERATREWAVGPENLDLKRFIFAKVLVYSAYPFPDRETTCGIFVLKLPGNGTVITWGMILLSLLGMGIGLYGLYQAQGPEQRGVDVARQLLFLSLIVLLGLVTAFMGWWILGIIALVISLLFVLISVGLLVGRSRA
ncbi:MAG: hypothetical protein HYZ22_18940 [Chloroflexi bacterium]|nr:hypothetical protein [Chloroflexota bacterium]